MELVRSIVVFNHTVDGNELMKTIPENFQGDIIIHGNFIYDYCGEREGECRIDVSGDLWVDGDVDMEDSFLNVHGDLACTGTIIARELTANFVKCEHLLRVRRRLIAEDVICRVFNVYIAEISGDIICNSSDIETLHVRGDYSCSHKSKIESAIISGNFVCEGCVKTLFMMILGNLKCNGVIDASDFVVNGNAKIAHGLYSDYVKVGGNLGCDKVVDADNVTIDGNFTCKSYNIGSLTVKGLVSSKA